MLSEKFVQFADQIDNWPSPYVPQAFKHNLTCALRIAAEYNSDEVLSFALQGDRNAYSEHLARQLEPVGRSIKRYLANAAANADGAWEAWQKAFPLFKEAPKPKVAAAKPEEEFNPLAGLFNILNPDQSRNQNVSCRANRLLSEGVIELKRESRPEKRSRLHAKRAVKAARAAAVSA